MSEEIRAALQKHKEEEQHSSRLGPYIHDIVYGANDGIVTTFAVVSGVTGAELAPSIVIILGFANVLADALSMGLGNYLSIKSKQDNYHRVLKEELKEIEDIPELEREEIREIYRNKGFEGVDLDRVVSIITARKDVWAATMMREEHGLVSEDAGLPVVHGLTTFFAFVLFGSIPIVPYLLPVPADSRFFVTIIATGVALLLVGLLRSWVTRERMFRGPLEVFAVGAVCALVAYWVGVGLKGFAGSI